MKTSRPSSSVSLQVHVVEDGRSVTRSDRLATEEPLEIRLSDQKPLAITMRTPGNDFELAAGFLFGEGVVSGRSQILKISYCTDPDVTEDQLYNIVTVVLEEGIAPVAGLERHFFTSSACGVCGKESLDALEIRGCAPLPIGPTVSARNISRLPEKLRSKQGLFEKTGGLHAAGLFDTDGELVALREDVGRHNAVDKLVGWAFLQGMLPLSANILMVSGRSSFEIMQKALSAGIPIVCAVSAPSSLAVDLARRFEMTLVGFLRGSRFNIYSGPERIKVGD